MKKLRMQSSGSDKVMRTSRPTLVVGIGGSAGALNAYEAFLDAMPSNNGMAFVIVSHITPTANSELAQILSQHTKMTVVVAFTAMPIRANHVYVIPPNVDLLVEGDTLKVISPRSKPNVQIDLFLTSLAKAMGPRAVGIVLSGYRGDGTEGCRQIKANGGTTFAQDASAEVEHMSRSAQAGGGVDFVLPPEKIPPELKRLASALTPPPPPETGALKGRRAFSGWWLTRAWGKGLWRIALSGQTGKRAKSRPTFRCNRRTT